MTDGYEHTPVTVAGKTTVVIGGTSGIGEAIALGFAAEGADVVATSRTSAKVESTAAKLRDLGADTIETTADVTDRDSLEDLYRNVVAEFGGVDVVVNSQGAIARKRVTDVAEADWQRVFDVAIDGVQRSCQAFANHAEQGSIINISSLAARLAMPDLIAYASAKGGVEAFTRAASRELAPEIRVNAIVPGFVVTPQNEDVYAEGTPRRQRIDERASMGRVAQREEIVGAAIYLASDAASYTTGEMLTVDGGFGAGAF